MKRNYTIKDIADYLDELGFRWVDYLVKDYTKERYLKVTATTLKKEMNVYIENKRAKGANPIVVKLEVDNETFVLGQETSRLDMSEDWKEFLLMRQVGVKV